MKKLEKLIGSIVSLLPPRAQVVLASAITYISTAATIVVLGADAVAEFVMPEQAEQLVRWLLTAAAVATQIVAIIRRSIPAPKEDRGLLTPPPKADLDVPLDVPVADD